MLAVDTNVLVRLLTGDDPEQLSAVEALFRANRIWVGKTVLLETEWVLRSTYGFDQNAICEAFAHLLGLPDFEIESRTGVLEALSLTRQGVQFADALHFSTRPEGAGFVTFDRTFVRRARRAGIEGISELTPAG